MILCFQCEDLSKILSVSKFETDWPNIKLIITFCAIWHYRDLKGYVFCYTPNSKMKKTCKEIVCLTLTGSQIKFAAVSRSKD